MEQRKHIKVKLDKKELRRGTAKEMVSDQHLMEKHLKGFDVFSNLKEEDGTYKFDINVAEATVEEYNDKKFYILNDSFAVFPPGEGDRHVLIFQE